MVNIKGANGKYENEKVYMFPSAPFIKSLWSASNTNMGINHFDHSCNSLICSIEFTPRFIFQPLTFFRISLQWLILCSLAICLNGSNLLGYTRARLGTSEKMSKRATKWILRNILRRQENETDKNGSF